MNRKRATRIYRGAIDPARYAHPEVRRLLVALDIGGLYRLLGRGGGLSQREIARRTGQSQSEVSDITKNLQGFDEYAVRSLAALRQLVDGEVMLPGEGCGPA